MKTIIPKILIVDDTPANLVALNVLLRKVNAEVIRANSGAEALQYTLEYDFALILLDAHMPEMDGYEVAEILNSTEETRLIPIIFVTAAYKDEVHRLKSYSAGAVDYIQKPIEDRILISKVNVFLELYNQKMMLEDMTNNLEQLVEERTEELRRTNRIASVGGWNIASDLSSVSLSDQAADILGLSIDSSGEIPMTVFMDKVVEEDREVVMQSFTRAQENPVDELSFEFSYMGLNQDIRTANSIINFMNIKGKGVSFVGSIQDITERKESERAVQYMAQYDALTNLPNRYLFKSRLEIAFATSKRVGNKVDVMLIDLDHFKDINDTLGHPIGDMLLQEVSKRLSDCVRDSDTVARLGGDEFAIIAIHALDSAPVTPLVKRCLKSLARPFELDGNTVHTAGSIGISNYPDDGDNQDQILKYADLALYEAKNDGRGTYHFYSKRMNDSVRLRLKDEAEIKTAITDNQFELYYQPQVDLHTKKVMGMEALVRWNHPERGLLSPLECIPLAEETGLIVPMGESIFKMATDQMEKWADTDVGNLKLSVNISVKQMHHKGFISMIEEQYSKSSMKINTIGLEITETHIFEMSDTINDVLQQLKNKGLMLAIDDFGTGFSSLVHLKQIPANYLKIDRMFVKNIIDDPVDGIIFKSIVELSHKLGMQVIAEGVETKEQLDFVTEQGCDIAQGYFFSPPLAVPEFTNWFHSYEIYE